MNKRKSIQINFKQTMWLLIIAIKAMMVSCYYSSVGTSPFTNEYTHTTFMGHNKFALAKNGAVFTVYLMDLVMDPYGTSRMTDTSYSSEITQIVYSSLNDALYVMLLNGDIFNMNPLTGNPVQIMSSGTRFDHVILKDNISSQELIVS
jgi:hypothetical protein